MAVNAEPFVVMAKPIGPLCNLDCGYCYYLSKRQLFPARERFQMSPEILETYVREVIGASSGPTVDFAWHGGEPTLAGIRFFQQALELQEKHLPAGWTCTNHIQTNGTLLNSEWCAFFAEHRFAVGISIDGPASLHDAARKDRRGRPTHDRVLNGLSQLRRAGIEPDVLCTVNALNASRPLDVYRFFLDAGVKWLQFIPIVERVPGGFSDRSVVPDQLGDFLCAIFDEWVRYDIGRIGVQTFLEPLLVVAERKPNLCIISETCGRVPALEHDGGLYACDHFVDRSHYLGNIRTDSLADLLDGPVLKAFGAAKRSTLPKTCIDCPVGFICNGGCPKDRISGSGEALNHLCSGYRRFYLHALPYLERIAKLERAGIPGGAIMEEIAIEEKDERARWNSAGRNDPCPCGSGTKYKQCCLRTRRR